MMSRVCYKMLQPKNPQKQANQKISRLDGRNKIGKKLLKLRVYGNSSLVYVVISLYNRV